MGFTAVRKNIDMRIYREVRSFLGTVGSPGSPSYDAGYGGGNEVADDDDGGENAPPPHTVYHQNKMANIIYY